MQKPRYIPTKITPNIKLKQEALKKSRQRLLGSVLILLVVLALLLYVTSRVKPIPINPDVVEIKNTNASAPVAPLKTNASSANSVSESTSNISNQINVNHSNIESTSNTTHVITPLNDATHPVESETQHGFRAAVVNSDRKIKQVASKVKTKVKAEINKIDDIAEEKPKVKPQNKINPADILNNTSISMPSETVSNNNNDKSSKQKQVKSSRANGKSYIQFAAMSTPEKANALQQELASRGINTSIEPIKTDKGTLYRLRAGPYSHETAQSELQQISNEGYSGIVTGN